MTLIKSSFPALTDFFGDDFFSSNLRNGDNMPSVNVVENKNDYEIEVAAPGFQKKDFNVTMDNGVLFVVAETEQEKKEEQKNYTRKEFSCKSFRKSFTLPENVKENDVTAQYVDGILKLHLEKNEIVPSSKKNITIG